MRKLLLTFSALALLSLCGCGPSLAKSKADYAIAVDAAATALNWASSERSAGRLSAEDINSISYAVERFEFYRLQVRIAIDANVAVPVSARTGMQAALTELALIQFRNGGVE